MKNQRLLETVADISYIAGEMNYFSGDSRADISEFIRWAEEFQKINRNTDWSETDYILMIDQFTRQKLEFCGT